MPALPVTAAPCRAKEPPMSAPFVRLAIVALAGAALTAPALAGCTSPASPASPASPVAPASPAAPAVQVEEGEPPALTIYNQDFAVVREIVPLALKAGVNEVHLAGMSALLEPDSVVLRDPSGAVALSILEQNYRADPVTQERLLALFEGQTIDFLVQRGDVEERVRGKIVRSGYTPFQPWQPRGIDIAGQPIIEVDGALRFSLPGIPLFPSLADDTILEPTLGWTLAADRDAAVNAELAYVTGGLSWKADYNVVAPETGDRLDLSGWLTMENHCGKSFREARLKLLAGDVNRVQPPGEMYALQMKDMRSAAMEAVTQKAFDEYHLYSVARPVTLHDRETKQVELVRASGIASRRLFVYDGAQLDPGWQSNDIRAWTDFGTQGTTKVKVVREFRNSSDNGLGIPLPRGRMRFYRKDTDGQLEFTGENLIDHTPKDETLRIETGSSFDLVGERTRVNYRVDDDQDWLDESFEIVVRNHKAEPVEVAVVEHLYRWVNWDITQHSAPFAKRDARTIEFLLTVPPDGEQKLSYAAHYTW
jgi:hypothetical protein